MSKHFKLVLFLISTGILSLTGQESSTLDWIRINPEDQVVISGQAWPNQVESRFHRLPKRAEKNVREPLWNLSKNSAGLSIRFWSNAPKIHIEYGLKGEIAMPHMPATGVSGLDLYSKDYHGNWQRHWGSYSIDSISKYSFQTDQSFKAYAKFGTEYQLYLPLYNEITYLNIGVEKGKTFNILHKQRERPIVAYGTSIAQGACASRPGMAWTNILQRKLDNEVVNLGFSGNGELEPEMIDLIGEIEASLYILDCLPNLHPTKDDSYQLTLNAVRSLKERRPYTPILLTEHLIFSDIDSNKGHQDYVNQINEQMKKAYDQLLAEGVNELYYLSNDDLRQNQDSFVDAIHPNDVGMEEYANAYEEIIRKILFRDSGTISTTQPVTQSRDISVYQWEERHQKILAMNQVSSPKVCLFGDSILHFWGGEPSTVIARGQNSWSEIMHPMGVRNFAYGWDRIENVIWRIQHGELDNIQPEQIVLMIGTNNLHLNTHEEILVGLESLVKTIQQRQDKASIILMGLMPRRDKEKEIKDLNVQISSLANDMGIRYAVMMDPFLNTHGKLNESLFTDGLHPNEQGYRLMAENLREILNNQ